MQIAMAAVAGAIASAVLGGQKRHWTALLESRGTAFVIDRGTALKQALKCNVRYVYCITSTSFWRNEPIVAPNHLGRDLSKGGLIFCL